METKQKDLTYEKARLTKVMKQILEDLENCDDKIVDKRASLIEINKNMLTEFKFESDTTVNLEGAATLWHYQSMGIEIENALEFQIKRHLELTRLKDSPYFARILFREEGDLEEIYIGSSSLVEKDGFEYLVYDWRAPISSVFYDFEEGKASYKAPMGIIEGILEGKRHYKIKNGQLEFFFDSNINIMDDMLKEALGKSADDKMKTIVTTIQKEQNQVIRDEASEVLVVRGGAGSGKTSIALHRIAYLLYKNRDRINNTNVLVFTPNDIFSDYISHVLPELGESQVETMTFMDYMTYVLNAESLGVLTIETWYDQMEFLLQPVQDRAYYKRVDVLKQKSSESFFDQLDSYIRYIETKHDHFEDILYKGTVIVSKAEMLETYLECVDLITYASRLKQLEARIFNKLYEVRKVVKAEHEAKLTDDPIYYDKHEVKVKTRQYLKRKFKPIHEQIRKMLHFDLKHEYNGFLRSLNLDTVHRHISYEDAVAMIYMKGRLDTIHEIHNTQVVVIDEAQDYTLIQYHIFKQLFKHATFTILGDPNQAIHPYLSSDIRGDLVGYLGHHIKTINLTKTYRSTIEINTFCNALLTEAPTTENLSRKGPAPKIIKYANTHALIDMIQAQIDAGLEKGFSSMAIIGKTKAHCAYIKEHFVQEEIRLINNEDQFYQQGVIIIPSYLAKGLEFDMVFVVVDDLYNYSHEKERKLFYTVCTRALHQLDLYYENDLPVMIDTGIFKAYAIDS